MVANHQELLNKYDAVSEDASVGGFTPEFTDIDGIKTRYYDIGTGDPIVLLHGGSWYGSASANTWWRNFEGLSQHFRVIAPDRLGNGMTDSPDDPADFVYESEIDHMSNFLLEEMGLDEFHLAGQSRGGGLAGRLAVEYPEKVKSLIIVNSSTLAPEAGDYDPRRNRLYRNAASDETSPEYHRFSAEQMAYETDHITDEYVQTCAYMSARPKAQRTDRVFGRKGQENKWKDEGNEWFETLENNIEETHHRIKSGTLTMPTLIWWAINDPTLPLRAGVSLYDMIAQENEDVRMKLINHAGHSCYREKSDEFCEDVVNFIKYWEKA